MKSLQQKREKSLDCEYPDSDRVYYPEVYIRGDQMSEIDTMEVGEEYEIKIRVRMRSYDKNETFDGTRSSACLELLAYEAEEKKDKE